MITSVINTLQTAITNNDVAEVQRLIGELNNIDNARAEFATRLPLSLFNNILPNAWQINIPLSQTTVDLFLQAIRGGNPAIVEAFSTINSIKNNAHTIPALNAAVESGNLEVVKTLLNIPVVRDSVDHNILRLAITNGHESIVTHFCNNAALRSHFFGIKNYTEITQTLLTAIRLGNIHTVALLLNNAAVGRFTPEDLTIFLTESVCHGHRELIERLLYFCNDEVIEGISTTIFMAALEQGNIDIAEFITHRLKRRSPLIFERMLAMDVSEKSKPALQILRERYMIAQKRVQIENYNNLHTAIETNFASQAVFLLAQEGVSEMVHHDVLIKAMRELSRISMLMNWPSIDIDQLRSSHCSIINYLLAIPQVQNEAHFNNNEALQMAIQSRCPQVVEDLLRFENVRSGVQPEMFVDAIRTKNTRIVALLLNIDRIRDNLQPAILLEAIHLGAPEIVDQLLDVENVRNGVEPQMLVEAIRAGRNRSAGNAAIVNLLLNVDRIRDNLQPAILLEAIRSNNFVLVRRLLDVETIREQAHADNNAALRLACEMGSEAIVSLLVENPHVQEMAGDRIFIQRNVDHTITLLSAAERFVYVSQDTLQSIEGSGLIQRLWSSWSIPAIPFHHHDGQPAELGQEAAMRSLNRQEEAALSVLKEQYADRYASQGGHVVILYDLQIYLLKQYEKNPVMHNGLPLLMQYTPGLPESVLQEYYANPFHTAYRYFLQPNPWIHPHADYVSGQAGASYADIGDDHRECIATVWLAITNIADKERRENMQALFTRLVLAEGLGRAHNWDNDSLNEKTQAYEHRDDKGPDRPSCSLGIRKRVAAFVTETLLPDNAATRVLDASEIRQLVRERWVAARLLPSIASCNQDTFNALKEAFDDLVTNADINALSESQQQCLAEFNSHGDADIAEIIEYANIHFGKAKNGEYRIEQPISATHTGAALIKHLCQQSVLEYADVIAPKMQARAAHLAQLQAQAQADEEENNNSSARKRRRFG